MGVPKQPFSAFGQTLKTLRQGAKESLDELSGALELDRTELQKIERGEARPSEEILVLLINHFKVTETESLRLWELAGYRNDDDDIGGDDESKDASASVMISAHDLRVVYTDMVHVMINNYGVVLNFMQGAGSGAQPLAIARVGMSKEHARSVIDVLTKSLQQAERADKPKQLPPTSSNHLTG